MNGHFNLKDSLSVSLSSFQSVSQKYSLFIKMELDVLLANYVRCRDIGIAEVF